MSTWGAIYNNTRMSLHLHSRKILELQEQAASGARVNRASDDPGDAIRILELRAQSESLERYGKNLDEVVRKLELSYSVTQEVNDNLRSTLEKLEQAASGTYNDNTRAILGETVNSILDQIVALANSNSLGQFLFSGAKADTKPYVTETDGQHITAVTYQGSRENLSVPVAPGVEFPGSVVGEKFFGLDDRQAPEFAGNTGAAPGSATSSVRDNLELQITHKETNVAADPDGSGLAMTGSTSVTDTVLGRHDLIVDTTAQTIQFAAGGPATNYTGAETSLGVFNADGDAVYVDVTGLNALGAPATVTIQSDGRLSIDEAAAAVDVTDFTAENVAVLNSDGEVLYVDARGLVRTGVENVRVPGTFNVFGTLIHAREALLNERNLPRAEQMALVSNALESVKEVMVGVTQGMTSLGAQLEALDTLDTSMANIQASASDQAGALENADLVQVAADLARTQMLYQMTLATTSKLLTVSLLDYI